MQSSPAQITSQTYQGSLAKQTPVAGVYPLSLDQAIHLGLQYNLGLILSGTNSGAAGAQRLQSLQALLPTIDASLKEAAQQVNLKAEGLTIPGFPGIIGPYGYTDVRASAQGSLIDLSKLPQLRGFPAQLRGLETLD